MWFCTAHLQRGERSGAIEVFVRRGLHLRTPVRLGNAQLFQQIPQAGIRKKELGAGQAGIAMQVLGRHGAARAMRQAPQAIDIALHDADQPLVQIGLDGA
ncbi:hypothetical protein P3W70_27935 [Achromobacter denitrificans]|uniref:hypothetical protein n=1 Tax=Achromobacter denitrificans TaxID=32002 RepID=UPI0023E87D4E|nr:hypothetical protein [Achromobacter denitrificans]MDF3862215.1 hypothetical protein [Achromobacter denitrificans]